MMTNSGEVTVKTSTTNKEMHNLRSKTVLKTHLEVPKSEDLTLILRHEPLRHESLRHESLRHEWLRH